MHWVYLLSAIIFEVMGTLSIKQTTITGSYYWGSVVVVFYIISFTLIGFAVQKIDIGTAYAIWSGFGTSLIVILGWQFFGESMDMMKALGVVFIVLGVVLLKLQSAV